VRRLTLAAVAALVVCCSSTQVQRESRAADAIARAFNGVVRPTLVDAFETACRAEIERVCPAPPCSRVLMQGVLRDCDNHWQPVFASYEAARAAHDAWRLTLIRCQDAGDAGSCSLDLERDGRAVVAAVTSYRCAVRALGRPELDPLPGTVTCARDGGL